MTVVATNNTTVAATITARLCNIPACRDKRKGRRCGQDECEAGYFYIFEAQSNFSISDFSRVVARGRLLFISFNKVDEYDEQKTLWPMGSQYPE